MTLAEAILQRVGSVLPGEGILVTDPDELVRAQPVADALASSGVELLTADDPVDLRLAFEGLAEGRAFALSVESDARLRSLPADIRALAVRETIVTAPELLAPLDIGATSALSWDELATAWAIAQDGEVRDRRAAVSLLLRRVYELDPDTMATAEGLLLGLLRYHRTPRASGLSPWLTNELVRRVGDPLAHISTERAIQDRRAFLDWLAELWHRGVMGEDPEWLAAMTSAPIADHLDEYFADGYLAPVAGAEVAGVRFGVVAASEATQAQVDRLIIDVEHLLNNEELTYDGWRDVAQAFAVATGRQLAAGEPPEQFLNLRTLINERFVPWVLENQSAIASLPALPTPAMVHRVPRAIQLSRGSQKAALVVMDGMSLASWQVLAPRIHELDAHVAESSLFAWIPTLTAISRQAIFAGSLPAHFASSLETTAKEADHWRTYWEREANLGSSDVGYAKLRLASFKNKAALIAALRTGGLGRDILGLAVEDIDLLLHSEVIDERALFDRLGHWLERDTFLWLLDVLLDEGYRVYITADHGFVGVESVGGSKAGATADKHGRFERYSDSMLADAAAAKTGQPWRRWAGYGLPPDYHIVFAPMFGMYFTDRHTRLTHGGPTIEEVIVPWVEIHR